MSGKFNLRMDRRNPLGEYPVYLQYSTMGECVRKSTGISIHPDLWLGDDGRTNKFIRTGRSGHPKGDLLNQRLLNLKREYDKTIESLMTNPKCRMTAPVLRSILNGTYQEQVEMQNGKVSFVDFVLNHNQDLYEMKKISFSLWENIRCNMSAFRRFLQQVKKRDLNERTILYCRDITVELIKEYILWRESRGNCNETINKALTPIFKAITKMMRLGWVQKDVGDEILELYRQTQSRPVGASDDDVHYLTEEQVRQFIRLTEDAKYPRTKELADMFLFSIHCGGMRFSDVCTLRWCEVDMEKRMIRHLQVKNHTQRHKMLNLPISGECMKILERWKGRNEIFVFGLLPDDFDLTDEEMLKHTLNSKNRTINQSLKCIGEKMGLPFRLHFHIARHTFATLAINRGVDLNKISTLMSHSGTWVTEKVYAKFLPETLTQVVDEKLDFQFD